MQFLSRENQPEARLADDFSRQEKYKDEWAEGQTKPNRLSLADQRGHDSPPWSSNSNFTHPNRARKRYAQCWS